MSSQRGNVSRSRPQKYKNSKAFKNNLHDKSPQTKKINGMTHEGLCQRCKEKIEWKIVYKKYKPLTQPATCVRCHGKTVKKAYHTVCLPCAAQAEVCAKCNTKQEIVEKPGLSEQEKVIQDSRLKFELQQLTERQRRSFFRHVEKGEPVPETGIGASFDGDQDHSEESDDDDCYGGSDGDDVCETVPDCGEIDSVTQDHKSDHKDLPGCGIEARHQDVPIEENAAIAE